MVAVGSFACSGGGDDFPIKQNPNDPDAAVDSAPPDDGGALDGAPADAPSNAAELSIAITDSPDPVAASSTLTYTLDVTNHGALDAKNVTVTHRLPSGNVAFQTATGIGWTCNPSGQVVTCTRATLLVGPAPSISVTVTTPPTGGPLSTSATVGSETPDLTASDNDATATTMVLTPADLAIAITDSPEPVAAGGTLTYTITVTNTGPGTSNGVAVLDSLPIGIGFVSASGTGWSCSAMDQDVTCLTPTLALAASATITLVVTAPTSGGTVSNTASVSAMTPDGNSANNQATTGTTVNAAADLSISMADSPDPIFGSGQLHYAIDVNNLGPNTASGLTVSNSLPSGNVTFVSAVGAGWNCNPAGQLVICTRPSLLIGAAPTITITVQAPSESTSLMNTATVTSTSSDLVSSNNTAVVNTSVLSAADLSVAIVDSPDPVTTTGALTYTVTATNAGPSQAAAVSVVTDLPPGTVFHSADGINWTCTHVGQQVTCTTPLLVVGAAPPIAIAVSAPGVDGTITAASSVSSATTDPALGNNSASQDTVVNAPSDLALVLTASPSPVPAGSTLTYTIDVVNVGPRDATSLTVTNRLPDGNVQFQSAIGIGWACLPNGQIITCTRGTLLVGAAPSIFIKITTPPTNSVLIDQASVSATTDDLDLTNNAASITTNVFDSADLSITTSETPDPVRIGTNLTYTLSVANGGPSGAGAIAVVDTLPAGTTFQSASGAGWTCNHSSGTVTCTMPGLAALSSAPAISIVATAPATAGNITNTATVGSTTSDPNSANNTATTITLANVFADLSVGITDTPDPVQGTTNQGCAFNDCVTYSIDVSNAGPDTAKELSIVTVLPPNGTFFNAVGTGWICPAPASGRLTCTRTSLAIGAAPTILLTWKAPSPGGFSIVVTTTTGAGSTDPNTANDTATQDTTVKP
ncbi:MAG TPA: hypothetical protein VLM79_20030 [Kofleriaceae bacterium]|nr:hypothetical protein [Kofleriaceae bacterium]